MPVSDDVLTDMPSQPLEQVAALIQDGDILLCAAKDLGSRLISWSTRSPWSHVALAYRWDALSRIMAFECVHTIGVRAVSIAQFIKRTSSGVTPYPGKIVLARHVEFQRRVETNPSAMKRMGDFAVDRFGDPFATSEVLKIAARVIFGRTGLRTPPALAPDDEFICSEYVAKCLEQVGIEVPWDGRGFIAPRHFAADPKVGAVALFRT